MKRDYYGILNISKKARPAQIKKAYRSAAKRHHPDVSPGGEEKFKEIQEAYETLSNPEKRAKYDRRDLEPTSCPYQSAHDESGVDIFSDFFGDDDLLVSFGHFCTDDLTDVFDEREARQTDFSFEVILTPSEARHGCNVPIRTWISIPCKRCAGTGFSRGLICGRCRGRGKEEGEREITLIIPGGLKDGTRFIIPFSDPDVGEINLIATIRVMRS